MKAILKQELSIAGVVVVAALQLCACSSKHASTEGVPSAQPSAMHPSSGPTSAVSGAVILCLPPSTDLSNPKPFYPNVQQVNKYVANYDGPPVRALRTALNAYRNGTADPDTMRNLRPYGTAFAADGFYLFNVAGSLAGGDIVSVQFHHHPDAQYDVWLYMLGGTQPSIRSFRKIPCSPAEQKWIAMTYASLLALGDDVSLVSSRKPRLHNR